MHLAPLGPARSNLQAAKSVATLPSYYAGRDDRRLSTSASLQTLRPTSRVHVNDDDTEDARDDAEVEEYLMRHRKVARQAYAVVKLQATWRMYLRRRKYLPWRQRRTRQRRAVFEIWVMTYRVGYKAQRSLLRKYFTAWRADVVEALQLREMELHLFRQAATQAELPRMVLNLVFTSDWEDERAKRLAAKATEAAKKKDIAPTSKAAFLGRSSVLRSVTSSLHRIKAAVASTVSVSSILLRERKSVRRLCSTFSASGSACTKPRSAWGSTRSSVSSAQCGWRSGRGSGGRRRRCSQCLRSGLAGRRSIGADASVSRCRASPSRIRTGISGCTTIRSVKFAASKPPPKPQAHDYDGISSASTPSPSASSVNATTSPSRPSIIPEHLRVVFYSSGVKRSPVAQQTRSSSRASCCGSIATRAPSAS